MVMQLDPVTTVRLFKGSKAKLKSIADNEGLDMADIIRWAVEEYISRYDTNPYKKDIRVEE
jgi:predicted DNA-binding protein